MGAGGVNRFVAGGESYCMLTLRKVDECEHCRDLAKLPPGPTVTVTGVDRDTGTVTLDVEDR